MDIVAVRQRLEQTFKTTLDRDVSLLAADYCEREGLVVAATLCQTSHETISNRLWSAFKFEWSQVQENPGGTSGRMSHFVTAKLEYTVAWAVANKRETVEVVNAEKAALEALHLLWLEWAGYMVTTSPEFALAL
jgi:hypothetical protein